LSEKLIPELLKQKDEKWKPTYSTHMVGKWHLGSCSKELLPINRGFDSFYGHYGGAIDYYQHTKNVEKFKYLDYFDGAEVNRNKTGIYSTYDFGEETRRVFKQVNEPKFIYLAYNAPHDPVSAPEQLIEDMKKFHPGVTESRAKYLASVKGSGLYDPLIELDIRILYHRNFRKPSETHRQFELMYSPVTHRL
jgi:arylsulfatase A-like enzyme